MQELFAQLHLGDAECGLSVAIAVLTLEPTEITERTGLRFEMVRDDLDYQQAALFKTFTENQFALIRYQHAPNPGTNLIANERSKDLGKALEEACGALGILASELAWIHPDIN